MSVLVPILMYHQVSPDVHPHFRKYTVSPRVFALHVRWMQLCGYQSITVEDLLAHRTGASLPSRPVLITFDDGFRDCYKHAAPVLASAGYTAVFYLVTGLMGGSSEWLRNRGVSLPLMTWAEARDLESAGFRCGAHTASHTRLPNLSDGECRAELMSSRKMLEDALGRSVHDLTYPFGACDARVRRLAFEAGYRSACSVRIGLSSFRDDPLMLPRVPVLGNESLADFAFRLHTACTPGTLVRERVRQLLRFFNPREAWQ